MNTKTRKTGARLGALLLSLCLIIGLLPMTALAVDPPTKRNTYNVYSDEVIAGGSDSQVYAVTIKDVDGEDLHYVYSPNAIHSNELMKKIREGLEEPYKSLIPTFDEAFSTGFLCFSREQEKYEVMELDWSDPEAVANALISGTGSVSVAANDDAVNVTDISVIHENEKIVTEDQDSYDDFYTNPPELGYLESGKNRVEASIGIGYKTEEIEGANYYDIFNTMYVAQISACTVTKTASESSSITLPVRVLEDEESGYVPRPDLTAAFTPDSAVIAGEFTEFQGLAIDYYNPMIGAQLSEGYDIQAEYTVTIPLMDYDGDTLSGTLTVPLPQGYDGASARIKGGAAASSYTDTTVSFPVTLAMEFGTTASLNITIEYKEAQEPVQPPVIIAGANGSWQKGGTDGLSFTSNAAFADFIKVQVDGKDLDASNYTVKEGSTIVTLNAAYLETLSAGKHTLSVVSANGTATTEFTITAAQTGGDQTGDNQTDGATSSPQTGDNSNMLLWVTLLFASGAGLFGATVYSRKKKYNQ